MTISDNFGGAKVRVCLEGATVRALVPIGDSAGHELHGAWIQGDTLDISRGRIRLPQSLHASCVDYETRFGTPMLRANDSAAIIVSQAQWLWRPDPFPRELDTSIRFVLPADQQVSLPWPHSDAVYFPDDSAFFAGTFGVFGSFDRQAFSAAGTSIDVARLGARPSDEHIRRWLSRAVQATASAGDRFPRKHLHFIIAPQQDQEMAVVFGMVRRGGGSSVLLLSSPDATVEQLEADWVAVHELSHLWLPPLYSKDRWISEGVATYLQEVLRARCGFQTSERAWTRLQAGFERGRRSGTGRRLASESRNMNRTGAYHRVYWAGAAFALEADVRLRKSSKGEMTLLSCACWGRRLAKSAARGQRRRLHRGAWSEVRGELRFPEHPVRRFTGVSAGSRTDYVACRARLRDQRRIVSMMRLRVAGRRLPIRKEAATRSAP
ncbi:MAG: hypothetical protein JRG70_16980, partial [Deltaproteobacteria bacterium]|nr:hypothetical protein [Deltaproteobacteria bacterium]